MVRGGVEPAEVGAAIGAVRRFIELHGTSRFEAMGELAPRNGLGEPIEQRVANRVGFRRRAEGGGTEYLVLPEAWRTEVCAGLDAGTVAHTLRERGMLLTDSNGKFQKAVRLPGFQNVMRCYVLSAHVFEDKAAAASVKLETRAAR